MSPTKFDFIESGRNAPIPSLFSGFKETGYVADQVTIRGRQAMDGPCKNCVEI
jgi:hypothetical protein